LAQQATPFALLEACHHTEQLGGYLLIDVANLDEALAVAGQIPAASKGTVEVRPVIELTGLPSSNSSSEQLTCQ
jgi:hypothetical protein